MLKGFPLYKHRFHMPICMMLQTMLALQSVHARHVPASDSIITRGNVHEASLV